MDLKLRGKKALVMGSSAGLGLAIAKSLIAEGVDVVLCARTADKLEKAVKESGAKAGIPCDTTKPGATKTMVEQAIQALGGIDILVTNTGGPRKGKFLDVTMEQWHEDFQSLWLSAVEALQVALPKMKEQKYGRILMVTSIGGKEPLPGLTTSNGLRAGLTGLAKSISNEVASFGVTVNALLPGYTDTDRMKELNLPEETVKQLVPMGRMGDPSELADLTAFLASPRGAYITGQSLVIDGGAIKGH